MKIAIPTRNDAVDDHFGHCEYFTIYSINEDNHISDSQFMPAPQACGCKSDLAPLLQRMGVNLMLAGNMGAGALQILGSHGIEVIRGCSGDVAHVVENYLAGKLRDSGQGCEQHGGCH